MGNCLFPRREIRVEPAPQTERLKNDPTVDTTREKSVYENFTVVKRREYHGDGDIITEYSAQHLVDEVIRNFQEKEDLDLTIIGKACPTWKAAARDRVRREEAKVLEELKQQGLLSSPQIRSSGGVSYDLGESLDGQKCKPARLAKLEVSRRSYLTEEQIKQKLELAEERRQDEEKRRILKIKKESEQIRKGLKKEMERKKEKEELRRQKMENVTENREQRLEAIRKRMKEREEHREKVRKMKDISLDGLDPAAPT